jgi:hypothetical protein
MKLDLDSGGEAALFFLLLMAMLLVLPGVCAAGPADCGEVRIKTIHPLRFGQLRAKEGASGWFLLETGKEYFMSPAVSVQNDSFPSPGQVQVTAPAGSRLVLKITALDNSDTGGSKKNICLKNLKISSRMLAVTKTAPDLYQVDVPESKDGSEVTFMLDIGGELSLKTATTPIDRRFTIYIEHFDIASIQ